MSIRTAAALAIGLSFVGLGTMAGAQAAKPAEAPGAQGAVHAAHQAGSHGAAHGAGTPHGASHGASHGAAAAAEAPSTTAFKEANARMHQGMEIAFTGDADVDFLRGMIAHHQGAVDMARVLLAHGKDPALQTLARQIIEAQEAEILEMEEMLAKLAP